MLKQELDLLLQQNKDFKYIGKFMLQLLNISPSLSFGRKT